MDGRLTIDHILHGLCQVLESFPVPRRRRDSIQEQFSQVVHVIYDAGVSLDHPLDVVVIEGQTSKLCSFLQLCSSRTLAVP